ncbi:hypothetical protein ACIRLA_28820 [Streptomyces sp. NPDC102364]|uniref:hypothetical protein n=1 Tax=Streptomyces sp. NPDC102364 TaxID=3366161 RepID=UPI0038276FAE
MNLTVDLARLCATVVPAAAIAIAVQVRSAAEKHRVHLQNTLSLWIDTTVNNRKPTHVEMGEIENYAINKERRKDLSIVVLFLALLCVVVEMFALTRLGGWSSNATPVVGWFCLSVTLLVVAVALGIPALSYYRHVREPETNYLTVEQRTALRKARNEAAHGAQSDSEPGK